jgi:hypothetical protein
MANTINASQNPDLVNNLVEKALSEPTTVNEPKIISPSENTVELPGGLITSSGEVLRTAEVRELTGKDEEVISKSSSIAKAMATLIDRGTVSIGGYPADENSLYKILAGDRDALLLGIYKATFGNTVDIPAFCGGCSDAKVVSVDIDEDVQIRKLEDPAEDVKFTVKGKRGDIVVRLPDGRVQKKLVDNSDKTQAELATVLLENVVLSIGGSQVLGKSQVQNLSLVDRRKVLSEIDDRVPGPRMQDISVECPDCGEQVGVPINFGTLFRF